MGEKEEGWPVFQSAGLSPTRRRAGFLPAHSPHLRQRQHSQAPSCTSLYLHLCFLPSPLLSEKGFVICIKALALSAKIHTVGNSTG